LAPGGLSGAQGFAIGTFGSFTLLVTLAVALKAATGGSNHNERDTGIQAVEEVEGPHRARTTEDTGRNG
jgi:hypothetical protein